MTLPHAGLNVKLISFSYFSHFSIFSSTSKKQNPFKLVRAIAHNVWQGRKQGFWVLFFFFF